MTHTALPKDELDVFASLEEVNVVVDVGARDDIDYLALKPDIHLHSFEPNPVFFRELTFAALKYARDTQTIPHIFLNNYGLGDEEGFYSYSDGQQAINGSLAWTGETPKKVLVRRLDDYLHEMNLTHIDFLKIDTEGYEFKVLNGGKEAIKLCRYIQFETYTSEHDEKIYELLRDDFEFHYTGYRNMLCVRKGEKLPWIPETPQEGGLTEKV